MKKIFLILLIFGSITFSKAQRHGVFLGLGANYTVGGQVGDLHTGIELNRHIIGVLFSKKIDFSDNKYNPSSQFIGMSYQFTTYREEHFQLGFQLRAGFSDDQFFVYFPSIMFDFVFDDYLKFGVLIGVRGQSPAYGFQMVFNLPTTKNEFPNSIWTK